MPHQITDGDLMKMADPEIVKYFTERRLRPLTMMAWDDEKINGFNAMKGKLEN